MTEIFDNIRQIYQFCDPVGELGSYIEFFSESSPEATAWNSAGEKFEVRMFPSWTPTFWINLGVPYRLSAGGRSCRVGQEHDVVVLRDVTTTRHNLPTDHIFTVKFFPGGLEAILGINQAKLAGRVVALEGILPGSLLQTVKAAGSFEERMGLVQDFFRTALTRRTKKDHYLQMVEDCIGLYEAEGLRYNTGEIAERMFVSSRTINRYFHQAIGLSPKKYFSILRARTALTAYVADKSSFEPETFGYYDRSHFHKEIVTFTGQRLALPV